MYFPALSQPFLEALKTLQGKRVAVLGHIRPDGDCIGSQVALCRCLNQSGIDAIAVNQDPIPEVLKRFVGDTPFLSAQEFNDSSHTAVSCDCAAIDRIGPILQAQFSNIFLCIDHHISNPSYAEQNLIVSDSAATAEILAGLFLDNNLPIDATTAQALYVGIATDTGQFQFNSTTQRVFDISSKLIARGANPAAAALALYQQEPFAKIKLLQHFLSSLKLELDGQVCIGLIPQGTYESLGADKDDSEGLVNYTRNIDGVKIGILLEERPTLLKGSLRAKHPHMRVDQIAASLNGGGHACAAGFSIESSLDDFYPRLVNLLNTHLNNVDPKQ